MWQSQFAVYLGNEIPDGYFGFASENDFFIVLEAKNGLTKDQGRQAILKIKEARQHQVIKNLVDLDSFISDQLKNNNLPTGISVACGYVVDSVIYLKTVGQAQIYIRRGSNFEKLIWGDQTASGILEKNDFFIFTIDVFVQLFGQESSLKSIFDHKTPHQIVEDLAPVMKTGDDQGAVSLFVQFLGERAESTEDQRDEMIVSQPIILEKGKNIFEQARQRLTDWQNQSSKKKTWTAAVVIILIIILLWSVILGASRRREADINAKINHSRSLIKQKLDSAQEVAFLNLARSQTLIAQSKDELNNLKKEVGGERKEIAELNKLIIDTENKIVKKEEKSAEEFFDLTVDNKSAAGMKMYLDEDNLDILDKDQGIIYRLSLTKKSLDKLVSSDIKSASLIATYADDNFFYIPGRGIFKGLAGGKPKLVLDKDDSWGKIVSFWIYNGNLYLLDSEKSNIDKYLAGENSYGSKSSYFGTGESTSLTGANSIAIDSSVYIGFAQQIAKFTAGVRDEFTTSFPDEKINITKIFTTKNLEKIYAWDKDKGTIYILSKNGSYERQVNSAIFSQGSDIIVFGDSAYVVIKEKIFKVNLD